MILDSFEHHAQACAQQYRMSGGEPALAEETMQRLAGLLILLVLLSSAVQAWTIRQAVVPAQDSVRYVGVAQRIDGVVAKTDQRMFGAGGVVDGTQRAVDAVGVRILDDEIGERVPRPPATGVPSGRCFT
mgnify:CR=1 FL=1